MKKASDPITRAALRAAVESAPDAIQVQVLLGLDGDCDFARQVTDFFPYLASKEELLALINAKAEEFPPALPHDPEYLVLGRRHAVSLRGILDALAG